MAHVMKLQEAVQHFQQYLTIQDLAKKLGVSKGQIINYANGTTVSCSDKVVDKFYDYFTMDGVPVLIDYFPSESVYISTRLLRDESFIPDNKTL